MLGMNIIRFSGICVEAVWVIRLLAVRELWGYWNCVCVVLVRYYWTLIALVGLEFLLVSWLKDY